MECAGCKYNGEFRTIAAMTEDVSGDYEPGDIVVYTGLTLYACPECGTVRVKEKK